MPKKKRKPSTVGRHSQRKGKALQHAVSRILSFVTGLTEDDFTSNHGGIKGESDILRSEAGRRCWPFRTEVKNTKTLKFPEWIRKLDQDAKAEGSKEPGIIVYKLHNSSRLRVDLDLDCFLDLMFGPLSSETLDGIAGFIRKKQAKKKTKKKQPKKQKEKT